jgi:AraC family transcriptional regulator, arabinose operon regulatory protein
MRKTAAVPLSRVRFWHFLAGQTVVGDDNESRIFRPSGMEAWVLHCTIEGVGEVGRGAGRMEVRPGDMMLFPAGVVHDYGHAAGVHRWVHLWATFIPRALWQDWMAWAETPGGARYVRIHDSVRWERVIGRMRDMIGCFRNAGPFHEDFAMNVLEEVLLLCRESNSDRAGAYRDPRITLLLDWMRDHSHEPVDIAALARRCALSPSRFAHLFRNLTGMAPMSYVEQLRITRAQELLLSTNLPIKRVAAMAGFDNPLYFSHVFRKVVGRAPRDFRGRR